MKRSLNEIGGMVLKAARGAGVPLGHCEDLAAAAVYLAGTDPGRLGAVLDALAGPYKVADAQWSTVVLDCPNARMIMAGPVAADALAAGVERVVLRDLDVPRLMLALCAARGLVVDHHFKGADLHLVLTQGIPPRPTAQAATVSDQLWIQLSDLASKTYVPATEASRLSGAGAGLNDND
jgi:hypothetical protein